MMARLASCSRLAGRFLLSVRKLLGELEALRKGAKHLPTYLFSHNKVNRATPMTKENIGKSLKIETWSMILTWVYGRTFILEGNRFDKLKLQTWAIPKYIPQYFMQSQKVAINTMIEEAILDADRKGIKVLSLGLRNQGEDLNINGGLYVSRHPKLKVRVVDGSNLVVAVVLNSFPKGTTQLLLKGKLPKIAYGLAYTLFE
ncbi:hypothetical protein JHK86_007030 [Glycine max]|nr:hypothetical protein JHK86_007030 [Glycine max]